MELQFRQRMLEKFAEDDRIEQFNQQKRRMKELEHKKEVERLWQEKLKMYREARDKEIAEMQAQLQEEQMKQEIIRQEKERIIREELADVVDFMPKGLIKNKEDIKFLQTLPGQKKTNYKSNFQI
eukprot:TRINITY_DN3768_c0_g4_i1.p3 TRINITY_DN3768_c0_g4~~TRINITY_DN3768_c0_g4_i1.p3  ORF type:complete len:125 (+),score=41.46 TRINITY_DN3768_c0_g4_i1:188-562(+)